MQAEDYATRATDERRVLAESEPEHGRISRAIRSNRAGLGARRAIAVWPLLSARYDGSVCVSGRDTTHPAERVRGLPRIRGARKLRRQSATRHGVQRVAQH